MLFFKKKSYPPVFHITHYKAGSQWIASILQYLMKDDVVQPLANNMHLRQAPIQNSRIYPAVYMKADEFKSLIGDIPYSAFFVFRDLRDTLVSHYFSILKTHQITNKDMQKTREYLESLSLEKGLLWFIENMLDINTDIQRSWVEQGVQIIKYEDIVENDIEILNDLVFNQLKLNASKRRLNNIIRNHRFSAQTGGRRRGDEDKSSHLRKGIHGDWKNHFTDAIKTKFKNKYGQLLIQTGYEKDYEW